ncbi:MAG: nucleotidyltransferase domain-containing protein, partial [bacterium]
PAAAFVGKGNILDLQVNCLTSEYQVESHQGYQLKEKDFKDVFLLCERFELEIPKEYQDFKK